jgi:O-methyltransferase involved in polyketide biosynthesis
VDYSAISPTAKLVAHFRQCSDVPLAGEIARRIGAADAVRAMLDGGDVAPGVLKWMAPLTEARYRSVAREIRAAGVRQVVELASGFTFRGAVLAGPRLRYVETDLPALHAQRAELRAELERDAAIVASPELVFAAADASSASAIAGLGDHLIPGAPVAVVHEGLLQYFSMAEKREVARGVGELLARFGGVWITPDFESLGDPLFARWTDPQFRVIGAFLTDSTRRHLPDAAFPSRDAVAPFFAELGFDLAVRLQIDHPAALSSAAATGATADELAALQASRRIWILRRAE